MGAAIQPPDHPQRNDAIIAYVKREIQHPDGLLRQTIILKHQEGFRSVHLPIDNYTMADVKYLARRLKPILKPYGLKLEPLTKGKFVYAHPIISWKTPLF